MTSIKANNLKIGDSVKIIAGNYKGIVGSISQINRKKNVASLDVIAPRIKLLKHKEDGAPNKKELKVFIEISNLMPWDKTSEVSSRIGYKLVNDTKVRYFKKSGLLLE